MGPLCGLLILASVYTYYIPYTVWTLRGPYSSPKRPGGPHEGPVLLTLIISITSHKTPLTKKTFEVSDFFEILYMGVDLNVFCGFLKGWAMLGTGTYQLSYHQDH